MAEMRVYVYRRRDRAGFSERHCDGVDDLARICRPVVWCEGRSASYFNSGYFIRHFFG